MNFTRNHANSKKADLVIKHSKLNISKHLGTTYTTENAILLTLEGVSKEVDQVIPYEPRWNKLPGKEVTAKVLRYDIDHHKDDRCRFYKPH